MKAKKEDTPIQYRFGGCFFCEMPFYVNKNVLIPRFCTETLVEVVIRNMKKGARILDLCTGAGAIACVLARHEFNITATDISRKALRVARKNARLHRLDIKFTRGDLFGAPELQGQRFDAIACNPPYVRTHEIGTHDPRTLHEPRIAFDGGDSGYDFYHRIAREADFYLRKGGKLFLEVGYDQAMPVTGILEVNGFQDVEIFRDLSGRDRVVMATAGDR